MDKRKTTLQKERLYEKPNRPFLHCIILLFYLDSLVCLRAGKHGLDLSPILATIGFHKSRNLNLDFFHFHPAPGG